MSADLCNIFSSFVHTNCYFAEFVLVIAESEAGGAAGGLCAKQRSGINTFIIFMNFFGSHVWRQL